MIALASLALPLLRTLPAERAHDLTLRALRLGFQPFPAPADDPILATRLWSLDFPNPVGLAAGFDKNAEVPDAMLRLGFGLTEIGTVTPRPQPGNPQPRVFRLPADGAAINRLGFNNQGLGQVSARLTARRRVGIVGGNIGKNRDTSDATADYCRGVATLAPLVDYLVINVSSPNTPGLRDLQRRSEVRVLIAAVIAARDAVRLTRPPPLLLKIAPDLTPREIIDLAETGADSGIDGMIISNTTTARPPTLRDRNAPEPGGLSGRPLFEPSTALLAEIYRLTRGRVPLIGVGGIANGADAYAKIRAGASLVQLYTALIYHGPGLVKRIKRDLAALLRRDGFSSVAEAVGVDIRVARSDVDVRKAT
ncbi:MAG TPA: quinone-dependent dihydroorotate dehydrogenase [Stellaceae bacterium]|nr:quinone-dependent dihydroorotate dehydrogenase [Stellaceae bacterium]